VTQRYANTASVLGKIDCRWKRHVNVLIIRSVTLRWQRAGCLTGNDSLAALLYQVCSPAHIPWGDERWQELLQGYDVWVHMDDCHDLIQQSSKSMAKHAELSSNLAAMSLHVTRMLRELARDIRISNEAEESNSTNSINNRGSVEDHPSITAFSKRISRVAKARATAGSLQLLQLLCHEVIVQICRTSKSPADNLNEVFTYHTRGDLPVDQQAGIPMVHSVLDLITAVGTDQSALKTPEIYDAVVLAFHLLFVLCGTQLYLPFESSFETNNPMHGMLEAIFQPGDEDDPIEEHNNLRSLWMSSRSSVSFKSASRKNGSRSSKRRIWSPRSILATCLELQFNRPPAPEGSLSRYYFILAQAAVSASGGEKPGHDGLFESYMVVQATAPRPNMDRDTEDTDGNISQGSTIGNVKGTGAAASRRFSESHNIILDATKGVLTFGGKIILLPFRLVSLLVGVFSASNKASHPRGRGEMIKKFASASVSRTRDVLWLSNSVVADMASSLILLLSNNKRNGEKSNPFRTILKGLTDNRWDENGEGLALPDLPQLSDHENGIENSSFHDDSFRIDDFQKNDRNEQRQCSFSSDPEGGRLLTLNFESLFVSFGRTLHTEVGALLLYTLLQASPSFAESLAVRSDLDTLVMPLLRTLYFASRSHTFISKEYTNKRTAGSSTSSNDASLGSTFDIRSCPIRSLSQLYVIIILLLLFSQDPSFGRDAFKRISVPHVLWYKERQLKNINLGSVLLLTLLRTLLFNLSRMHDAFILSNCCAVMMNLSTAVAGLHEYASMRLASVAVTVMKKHAKLDLSAPTMESPRFHKRSSEMEGEEFSSPLSMHAEVAHTLLTVIKQSLSPNSIEANLHLTYALVYHQADLIKLCKDTNLYSTKETGRILSVTLKASSLIQAEGARTAPKALKVLQDQVGSLIAAAEAADAKIPSKRRRSPSTGEDDYTFTYEEEADPEIFFVPYVWEVVVCCTTSTTISWKKDDIRVFPLLEKIDDDDFARGLESGNTGDGEYAKNVDELV
jgi:hypothetical protein